MQGLTSPVLLLCSAIPLGGWYLTGNQCPSRIKLLPWQLICNVCAGEERGHLMFRAGFASAPSQQRSWEECSKSKPVTCRQCPEVHSYTLNGTPHLAHFPHLPCTSKCTHVKNVMQLVLHGAPRIPYTHSGKQEALNI